MSEFLYSIASAFLLFMGAEGIFVSLFAVLILEFLICLFLSIFKRGYLRRKRIWLIVGCASCVICYLGFDTIFDKPIYGYILFALSSFFCSVVFSVSGKANVVTEAQRKVAKEVIEKADRLKNHKLHFANQPERTAESVIKTSPIVREKKDREVDFSHVIRIINRLNGYELSPSDRKQVKNLEDGIFKIETDGVDQLTEQKINDGLGALLKIMSKYGV